MLTQKNQSNTDKHQEQRTDKGWTNKQNTTKTKTKNKDDNKNNFNEKEKNKQNKQQKDRHYAKEWRYSKRKKTLTKRNFLLRQKFRTKMPTKKNKQLDNHQQQPFSPQ